MHTRSTSARVVAWILMLALSACSTLPGSKPTERSAKTTDQVSTQASSTSVPQAQRRDLTNVVTVPIPKLDSGTQALYDRAIELMAQDKLEAAEVLLLELVESQPELAGPWVNLALLQERQGNVEAATDAFTMALQANPKNCVALTSFGLQMRRQGDFSGAEALYQRCIRANPAYADAYLNLGILYELYMGRYSEALAAYNDYQVMVSNPDQLVAGWVIDLERRVAAIAKR